MKFLSYIVLGLIVICSSCNIFRYGENVKEDAKSKFQINKIEFRGLGFSGIVETKTYSEVDKLAPYRLFLNIDDISQNLTLSNVKNPPYYSFDSYTPKKLELSVSEEIFNTANKGDKIIKLMESDTLQIDTKKFELLKQTNSNWN
jgi:Icc-related predicted phosphoesterase